MPPTSVRNRTACKRRLISRIQRAWRKFSRRAMSAADEFRLDADDAEEEGQHGAARVEEDLAHVHHPAREVLVMAEDLGVVDRGLHGLEDFRLHPARIGQ